MPPPEPQISYERVGTPNILSSFVVGRPGPEYGLPVAVIKGLLRRREQI